VSRVGRQEAELADHRQVVADRFVANDLPIAQGDHVDVVDVDLAPGGRDDLVEPAVAEPDERAGVAALHLPRDQTRSPSATTSSVR
jgi:hypothetical protein